MGGCSSIESSGKETAKLILPDGTLQEFSSPVKAWQVLQKNPTCFICNSDEMDFDDVVSAVNGNADLRPGQLYFVLPLTWLDHPLRPQEMAALAVKASSALTKSGVAGAGDHWAGAEDASTSDGKSRHKVSGGDRRGSRQRCCGGGGGKGKRNFTVKLSTIPE